MSSFTNDLRRAMAYFTPHKKYRGKISLEDVEVVLKPAWLQGQGLGPAADLVGEGDRGTKRAREEEDGGSGEEEGGEELLDEEDEEDEAEPAEPAERESKRRRQDAALRTIFDGLNRPVTFASWRQSLSEAQVERLVGGPAGDAGGPPEEEAEDVEIRALDSELEGDGEPEPPPPT